MATAPTAAPAAGARRGDARTFGGARAPLAALALVGLVVSGALICFEAAARKSTLVPAGRGNFPGWLAGPLPGIGDGLSEPRFCVLLLVMCGCYLAVLALAGAVRASWAIGAVVALHVLFVLAPPLMSADVFGYIDWARLGAIHGLDPYSHGAPDAPHDPAFGYMRWSSNLPSPYGPTFTLLTYAIAPLSLSASLWILKGAAGLASLGCLALVWACAKRLGRSPVPALLFVGLNPLLLVFEVGGAHNDMFFMLLVLAALYLTLRLRESAASAAIVAAATVKASAGLLLPFTVLAARDRRAAIKGAVITLLAFGAVMVIGFGENALGFLRTLRSQQQAVAALSVPNKLSHWLGFGHLPGAFRAIAVAIFVATLAAMLVRTAREREWLVPAGWTTFALLATSAWILPWYAVWLLPLAALGDDRRLRLATLVLCAFIIGTRVPIWLSMPG
jgi:hypothetical protein